MSDQDLYISPVDEDAHLQLSGEGDLSFWERRIEELEYELRPNKLIGEQEEKVKEKLAIYAEMVTEVWRDQQIAKGTTFDDAQDCYDL
jgi:hypothetical protein